MRTVPLLCVTVVAEAVLSQRLVHDLEAAGARGWTVTSGQGRGTGSIAASEWEGPNIRVETLVPQRVADQVLEMLVRDYFPHFAVVAWVTPVQVVRPEKFS